MRKGASSMALLTSCCFTGHRPKDLPEGGNRDKPAARRLILRLKETVEQLSAQGTQDFYCGGALGFDTWAAQAVLEQRDRAPIRLHLILPYWGQESAWGPSDQAEYQRILRAANEVRILSERYYPGCMQARNRALVDRAACVIGYCVKKGGGTAYTLAYARQQGRRIILLSAMEDQLEMNF